LLENQYSVEVLGEHHLSGRMSKYPLIVIPEWEYLEPKFKDELVAYAKSGGKILLIGKSIGLLPAVRGIATTEATGLLQRVRELFPEPMVEVSGSHGVDVCVARNHGKLLVNLVNTSGPHRTQSIIEAIPSVGALTVTIRHAKKPVKVTLEPAGQPLPFTYRDGKIQLTVPQVSIHEIIVIESK